GAEDYQSAGGAGILEQIGIERGGEAVQPVLDPGGREGAGANEGLRPEPNGKKVGGYEDADQNRVRERPAGVSGRRSDRRRRMLESRHKTLCCCAVCSAMSRALRRSSLPVPR